MKKKDYLIVRAIVVVIFSFALLSCSNPQPKEPSKRDKLSAQCTRNIGNACFKLYDSYFSPPRGSISLLEKACTLNDGEGCNELGSIYVRRHKYAKAVGLLEKSCNLNIGKGCYSLAKLHMNGEGVPKNTSKAQILYKKSCDLGNKSGCSSLKDTNIVSNFTVYKNKCNAGDGKLCRNIGSLFYYGTGLKKSYKNALVYFKKSCSFRYASGCFQAADIYYTGRGVPQNICKAQEYYKKECHIDGTRCRLYEMHRSLLQGRC